MFYRKCRTSISACIAACLFSLSTPVNADIVISGTRVIYNESAKEVSVRLENKGVKPLLVQTWIDKGNEDIAPEKLQVPFTIAPPVFRIEPNRGQSLQVVATHAGNILPKDRESVFWLNVLEIPPKSADKEQNQLQLAFKTRIKLFWRPQNLKGSPTDAASQLKWKLVREGNQTAMQVHNDSVWHISFSSATLISSAKKYEVDASMVAPLSQATFPVKGLSGQLSGGKVDYVTINDFGGGVEASASF